MEEKNKDCLNEFEKEITALKVRISVDEERLIQLEKQTVQYRGLSESAIAKAYEEMNRRLEGMNEFRDQLKDQASTFVTISTFELSKQAGVSMLAQTAERLEGQTKALVERLDGVAKASDARIVSTELILAETLSRTAFDAWKKENDSWKATVAPIADVKLIDKNVDDLKSSFNQFNGMLRLVQFLGWAGGLALLLALLRMAGAIH